MNNHQLYKNINDSVDQLINEFWPASDSLAKRLLFIQLTESLKTDAKVLYDITCTAEAYWPPGAFADDDDENAALKLEHNETS